MHECVSYTRIFHYVCMRCIWRKKKKLLTHLIWVMFDFLFFVGYICLLQPKVIRLFFLSWIFDDYNTMKTIYLLYNHNMYISLNHISASLCYSFYCSTIVRSYLSLAEAMSSPSQSISQQEYYPPIIQHSSSYIFAKHTHLLLFAHLKTPLFKALLLNSK